MKNLLKNKKIVIIGIALILIVVSGLIYYFTKRNSDDKFIVGNTLKIDNNSDYLIQYDNGDYYLMKASADIKFSVLSEEEKIKYNIVDENEKEVETNVSKKENYYTISSNKKYEEGKTYKITLENARFSDEKLKDIKTLYFTIVRPNSNTQVLNDNIIKVNSNIITNITQDENYYTITSNKEFKKDDILYYQNDNQVFAFKVNEINKENNNYTIKASAPTLDELFKELDIYGEFNLELNNFISNEELKDYIEVAIAENGLLDNIVPNVYAKDILDIKVTPQKDGSAKVLVSINLNHGNKAIFKDALENHDMKLDIEFIIKLKAHADITLFKQDIGASLDIDVNTDFNISPIETKEYKFNFDKDVNDDLNIKVGLFKDILDKAKSDTSKDDITLGKMVIPTPVLGLNVDLEMGLIKELELVLKADLSVKNNFNILFGYNDKGFYKNFDFSIEDSSYNALGKAEAKLGLNPKVNVNFCKLMEIGIEAPLGIYADGQINYMNSSNKDEIDGKMEIGAFVSAGIYAKTHFIVAKVEATYEKKLPIINLEGKIKDKCEEQVLNGDFSCYIGTYKDSSSSTTLEIDKDGIVVESYSGKRAKLKDIKVENGIYYLTYDLDVCNGCEGQESPVYNIIPIDVNYTYSQFPCMACDSDNCQFDSNNDTCYYNSDTSKIRISHMVMSWESVYYND